VICGDGYEIQEWRHARIMTTSSKIIQKIDKDKRYPLLVCIFCKHYLTDNEFDLDLHLYEEHRLRLVKLPIGKGSLSFRIGYAISEGRRLGELLKYTTRETWEKLGWNMI
jgi:hypothetical protein